MDLLNMTNTAQISYTEEIFNLLSHSFKIW